MTIAEFRDDWRPWVTDAVEEIVKRFPGTQNQGTYNGHDPSKALAADLMVPIDSHDKSSLGYKISRWAAANAVRLGIWYIIWDGEIWSRTGNRENEYDSRSWSKEKGWHRYFDYANPNPSRSHKNHDHISFYDVQPPKPTPIAPAAPSAKVFKRKVAKGTIQGYYDPKTSKKRGSRGPRYKRKVGFWIVGVVVKRSDGRYVRTKHGTLYPLDNGNFAGYPKKG